MTPLLIPLRQGLSLNLELTTVFTLGWQPSEPQLSRLMLQPVLVLAWQHSYPPSRPGRFCGFSAEPRSLLGSQVFISAAHFIYSEELSYWKPDSHPHIQIGLADSVPQHLLFPLLFLFSPYPVLPCPSSP